MNTVTFKNVLRGVAHRSGENPDGTDFTAARAAQLTEFINEWVAAACGWAWWPEWMVCEERHYRDAWDATKTYAAGDEVEHGDLYYVSLLASNINEDPETATTYWEEIEDLDKYVAWEQDGFDAIGEVRGATRKNPRTNTTYPGRLSYELSGNGIQFGDLAPSSVWLDFRKRPPEFTSTAWAAGTTYAVGDLVYYGTTGECYKALLSGTNQNPATATTYWEKVNFPRYWVAFVKQAAYSDTLRADGQIEKAGDMENRAWGRLANDADQIGAVQQQEERATGAVYP